MLSAAVETVMPLLQNGRLLLCTASSGCAARERGGAESEERREQTEDARPVTLPLLEPTGDPDASEEAWVDASVGTPQEEFILVSSGGDGCFFELVLPVTLGWIATTGTSVSATQLTSVAVSGAVS